jgi:hypothetical protein
MSIDDIKLGAEVEMTQDNVSGVVNGIHSQLFTGSCANCFV